MGADLLFDFEASFPSRSHDFLWDVLTSVGIPKEFASAIKCSYMDNKHVMKFKDRDVESIDVRSGVRQGCPLSPYLFVIFLTVLLHDVKQELSVRFPQLHIHNPYHVFSANTPLLELAYADDLLFVSRSSTVLQEVFTTLQKHANCNSDI